MASTPDPVVQHNFNSTCGKFGQDGLIHCRLHSVGRNGFDINSLPLVISTVHATGVVEAIRYTPARLSLISGRP